MEYDMGVFFQSRVTLHAELTDADPATYPNSGTPYGPKLTSFEDGQGGPRGEILPPAEEALAACLEVKADAGPPDIMPAVGGELIVDDGSPGPLPRILSGILQYIAAKVLMKIFYGARMERFDLLRAVCTLAACVTKWTEQQGMELCRLICHINSTVEYRAVSWVGDDLADVWIRQYADADLASDVRTHRSTSANTQKLWGAQHQGTPELQRSTTDSRRPQCAGSGDRGRGRGVEEGTPARLAAVGDAAEQTANGGIHGRQPGCRQGMHWGRGGGGAKANAPS